MEQEARVLKEIIPIHPDLAQSSPVCDVLTEQERLNVVDTEIRRLQDHYAYRMKDKGMHPGDIEAKISAIDWRSMVDEGQVIESANLRKFWALQERSEQLDRVQKMKEAHHELKKRCDANYFYQLVANYFRAKHSVFLTSQMDYVKALCYFLSEDSRFETDLGYSFRKGLMIIGTAGLGKTDTILAVKDNPVFPISVFSMIDITNHLREHGSCEINTNRMILLDDVGSETELVKHYGNQINWFKEFVESYYLHHESYSALMVTTNCGGEELEAKYGYRVRSRIREMFNIIQLSGNDLRK